MYYVLTHDVSHGQIDDEHVCPGLHAPVSDDGQHHHDVAADCEDNDEDHGQGHRGHQWPPMELVRVFEGGGGCSDGGFGRVRVEDAGGVVGGHGFSLS